MKRYGNLWDRIIDIDNIKLAIHKASLRRTSRSSVKKVNNDVDTYAKKIQDLLISGKFNTAKYNIKTIFEPKERQIYVLPFYPDRIVQHAVMNIVEPIFDKMFIYDSYSCRKDKGPHAGSKRCMKYTMKYKYCYKYDIRKFYPTVNHEVLKDIITKKIKDQRVLDIIFNVIDSVDGDVNLPIGNYMSQWLGNLYLNSLDMFVKHELHVEPYIRYCDDFCIFGNSKSELKIIDHFIRSYVQDVLHQTFSKADLFKTKQGVDFLGYRHFHNGKILVRKSTAKTMKKRMAKLKSILQHGSIPIESARGKWASTKGWIQHAKSHNLYKALCMDEIRDMIDERDKAFKTVF